MSDSEIRPEHSALDSSPEFQKADRKGALLVSLPKWILAAVIAWQIRLSIEALVGEHAIPSLLTRFWRQASIWEVVTWGAGILGLIFGLYSRHLLKRQLVRDLSRLSAIENRLDTLKSPPGIPNTAADRSTR
jgi:hypothetical protein